MGNDFISAEGRSCMKILGLGTNCLSRSGYFSILCSSHLHNCHTNQRARMIYFPFPLWDFWRIVLFVPHFWSWKTSKHLTALPFSLTSTEWKVWLKHCFPTDVLWVELQSRELFMLISRKRHWCLMAAAAHWAMLFPSAQKILFPVTSVLHVSNFWRVFIHYRLQLCFLSTCFSGTAHYASVFCVGWLDSPGPFFIVISPFLSLFWSG